jgi:hypothetical protein
MIDPFSESDKIISRLKIHSILTNQTMPKYTPSYKLLKALNDMPKDIAKEIRQQMIKIYHLQSSLEESNNRAEGFLRCIKHNQSQSK